MTRFDATSKEFLRELLSEADPDAQSELTFERLIARAKEHGFEFWVLSKNELDRGYRVWVDNESGTFLPLHSEEVSEYEGRVDCFIGTINESAAICLQEIRQKFGTIKLNYFATSVFEGMLIESVRREAV